MMNIIEEFSMKNIDRIDEVNAFIYECICCVFVGLILRLFCNITFEFLLLPFIIILTLIIHESIHILFFKILNKESLISIKTERNSKNKIKAICIYQSNKNIAYNKLQTFVILLSPVVLITFFSSLLLLFIPQTSIWYLIISINAIINAMGSATDVVLSLKLIRKYYFKEIAIKYDYRDKNMVVLICENKEELKKQS